MTEEIKVKRPRGNPNFIKKDKMPEAVDTPMQVTTVMTEETKYADSVVWTMFMQVAIQTWDAKTEDGLAKAATVADAAMIKYKERFKC